VRDSSARAVAVDLGATSVRFALGTLEGGRIRFEVIEQTAHEPVEERGGLWWRTEALLGICERAAKFAKKHGPETTLGIDSWGVDHGFVGPDGTLLQPPACYRAPVHAAVFEEMKTHRRRLYELTGIQHQPFNTAFQLVARGRERPDLRAPGVRWLILPELMHQLLGCSAGHELTQASTTQLLGLDGKWSKEAFEIIGWPVPDSEPREPGTVIGSTKEGIPVVRVGGHDTASAVCGMGSLGPHQAFLNVGTWALLGVLVDAPIATPEAEAENLTNERAVDGRVRFLDNVPGFYVINRLHEDLGLACAVPEWLGSGLWDRPQRIDLSDPALFNPESMLSAVSAQLERCPESSEGWAGLALSSLVDTIVAKLEATAKLAGRQVTEIRVAGGGSASVPFCRSLARASGRTVVAGPQEATLLGNLGVQFLAQGVVGSFEELGRLIDASLELIRYEP
jgi:rhamnulokinase